MSDLGRLFRWRGGANQEPLENFTTEALAIAIDHDDRPMREALKRVDCGCENEYDGKKNVAPFDIDPSQIVSIRPKTQVVLWKGPGVDVGYLDLVLHATDARGRQSAIWVEVKVDAGESGSQLANYCSHAALRSPSPVVITLARDRVSKKVPALRWSDIVDAVAAVTNPHHAWLSLRAFLRDERIVARDMPAEAAGAADPHIDTILAVNRLIREMWPETCLIWWETALRKSLRKSFAESKELEAGAGPLRYGLMPNEDGDDWSWSLVVTTKNYRHVRLDAREMLERAYRSGLPDDWQRYRDRAAVLERRLVMKSPDGPRPLHSRDEVLAWFKQGLEQLRDAGIVQLYLDGVAAKQQSPVTPPPQPPHAEEHVTPKALLDAVRFAALKHQKQRRKDADASPYINHPIGVAHLLAEVGGISDPEMLIAAVLHDTVEDTETSAGELQKQFGETVCRLVLEVTDDKMLDKAVRKQLQVEHAGRLSSRAKMIKIADKISNVLDVTDSPPADWDVARRLQYLDWTEQVVAGCRGVNKALEERYDAVLQRGRAVLASPVSV